MQINKSGRYYLIKIKNLITFRFSFYYKKIFLRTTIKPKFIF